MKVEKLQFHLPRHLIAQKPADIRSKSRLLVFKRHNGELIDSEFDKIGDFLSPGDCLVLNDTKVLPARFFGKRAAGGKLEGLFLTQSKPGLWQVYIKGARKIKLGEKIHLKDKQKQDFCTAEILAKETDGKCWLKLQINTQLETILDKIGFPPLPPYIKRDNDPNVAAIDSLRYQTVYAKVPGAVAAPTAGLHFTEQLIEQLKKKGICFAYITLHIGPGTFKPITTENLEEHKIDQEQFYINEQNAQIINATKDKGGRIIAVGTTSVRTLETAAIPSSDINSLKEHQKTKLTDWRVPSTGKSGTTNLFIMPGYKFKIIDAMITNFHLPRSTLLALVAAFAGLENILAAYKHAIEKQYRFYSYGDAMLII